MRGELSPEDRVAGLILCALSLIATGLYAKFMGIKILWPLTWVVMVTEFIYWGVIHIGIPSLVIWFLYWCVKEIAESKVDYLRDQAREGFNVIKARIGDEEKSNRKHFRNLEEEIRNLRLEIKELREAQEKMRAPVEVYQEQALQDFL